MEDKVFELLTKMYSEFDARFNKMDARFNKMDAEIQSVGNQVTKLEQDHGKKLDALFDGYKQLAEGQEVIKSQLYDLDSKMEKQDVEIRVIKAVK